MWRRRGILALLAVPAVARAERLRPVGADDPEGTALVAALRAGGHVLFFRHADTRGEPCDRDGQRNISPDGRAQSARIGAVLAEHRRLFSAPVAAGANRVLVGHRTPAIMIIGDPVAGRAFPEGSALVLAPNGGGFAVLGILEFAPLQGGGFHGC